MPVHVYSNGGKTMFQDAASAALFLVDRHGQHAEDVEILAPRRLFDETWREVDRLLAAKKTATEHALTQCQHIAYDAELLFDAETGKRGPLSHFEQAIEAKIVRIRSIAESGVPDDQWEDPAEEADDLREQLVTIIGEDRMPREQVEALVKEFNAS